MAKAVKLLRLSCPQCSKVAEVQVGKDTLAAAASSPTGLVGIADYHGDHVFIVYVDREGKERGVRVFRALQKGEVIRVNPSYLSYATSVSGFRVSSGGWCVECFSKSPRALLCVLRGGGALDVELRSLERATWAVEWGDRFLEALERVGQPDPGELLLAVLLLDASLQQSLSPFAARLFERAMRARRLVVRVDRGATELLREYAPRVPWLSPRLADFALGIDGWRLVDAMIASDSLTMRERLSSLLALERRGVVSFEVVGA